jgi:ABC-type amino acid transport/signal transduction systems, periplasmic component/domain
MKKMKKLLVLLLSVTLFASVLTACKSSKETNNTTPTTEATKETSEPTATSAATQEAAISTPAAAGTARTLDQIKQSGKVIIGVFSDKKPFGYVDENGAYQGYDVYFGNRIAKDLGVEVEYVPVDPASRVEYLESAKVDIILANFTVTEERAQKVDFALPYMKVALGIVSPDKALITDPAQLKGKTLIIAKGTTAETYFTANYPDVKLLKFDQYADAYSALLDGRGDAFSTDNTEVLAWALENKGFSVGVQTLGDLDTIAPAVQKGNTNLLNWLNDEIKTMGKEKFFHADYTETLAPVYGDAASPDSLVVEGGVVE